MRIAWATPFNVNSAIARFSREICHELLSRGFDVEILRLEAPQSENIEVLETTIVIHPASADLTDDFLRGFDAVVVNLGDYIEFHYRAIGLISRVPTITIFHDSDLSHFVSGAIEAGLPIGQIVGDQPVEMHKLPDARPDRYAQLAMFAGVSCACVAHSDHYDSILRAACSGPVITLPLCYPDLGARPPRPGPDDRLLITTFGMINGNKQANRVMQAIAASPRLKKRAVYRLVGPIDDNQRNRLTTLAAELGLNPLEVYGRVDDEHLFELLSQSDVICCLRYPVTEGGSASLITALYSGRPLIVPSFASYNVVPDEIVWKVSYGEDVEDLTAALQSIDDDRGGAELRVQNMKAWALATYSATAYVDKLLPLLDQAVSCLPLIETGRSLGHVLKKMTVGLDDPAVKRLDLEITKLFGGEKAAFK
jgi:glycosyltransferase involved in cell wall biosynthesis